MEQIKLNEPIKLVAIMGSPRKGGNTDLLVQAAAARAEEMGAEVTYIALRKLSIKDCIACEKCATTMKCIQRDDMQSIYPIIEQAQGIIIGSPTYFYSVTGLVKIFLDRLYPYELFDKENRHVWMGAMENGIRRFALTISVGEQQGEKDLGYTSAIMRDTLNAIGFRSTDNLVFGNSFEKGSVLSDNTASEKAKNSGEKLVRSCLLARKFSL